MFKEKFDRALAFFNDHHPDQLLAARARFSALTGDFSEDDHFYEHKIQSFLEWFFFDFSLSGAGQTPLFLYLRNAELPSDTRDFFQELTMSVHSIFEVKSIKVDKQRMVVQDLSDLMRYEVKERRYPVGIEAGDLIDARIFPHRDHYLFTDCILMHPRVVSKVVKRGAKKLRKQEGADWGAWLITMAKKRWFLDRYPKSNPEKVYQDDFIPTWFPTGS